MSFLIDPSSVLGRLAVPAVVIGLLGAVAGFGFKELFPGADRWAYDRQATAMVSNHASASIVLVPLAETGPASCGEGRWHTARLARTISALTEAGAVVIAPAMSFSVPTPVECGDITGFATLIEATRRAGRVVVPASVPPSLAQEARAVGIWEIPVDGDGVVRRVFLPAHEQEGGRLPLGLAAGTVLPGKTLRFPAGQALIPYLGRWEDRPLLAYPFSEIWQAIQAQDLATLSRLVKDKAVVLFPAAGGAATVPTPLEAEAPLGFLHAQLLNAAVTDSWRHNPSEGRVFFRTLAYGLLIAGLLLWKRDVVRVLTAGLLVAAYTGFSLVAFTASGEAWPLLSPLIGLVAAAGGAGGWAAYRTRLEARAHRHEVQLRVTAMEEELARKEALVERLEEEVIEAKNAARESTRKYREAASSIDTTQARLHAAQAEAEEARRRLQGFQEELHRLRRDSPVSSEIDEQSLESAWEPLRRTCEAFGILTRSPKLLKAFQALKKAAETDSPILLLGETGTGKELFARAVHGLSRRADRPFVPVNVAAIRAELFESEVFGHVKGAYTGAVGRRGLLEAADGGTLFLDEIADLGMEAQAKLLRVLEDGSFYRVGQAIPTAVDVRIVAATNRDLGQAVGEGRYREDLYYRLRSIVVRIPPLRERGDDVELLARHFVATFSDRQRGEPLALSQGALQAVRSYPWPGNVRELRQTIAQAVALAEGRVLTEQDLRLSEGSAPLVQQPLAVTEADPAGSGKEELNRREDAFVLACLRRHRFDMQATANALNWDRSTVTQRLKGMAFQALVDHRGDIPAAAAALAGETGLGRVVEMKLREYYNNLLPATKRFQSVEQAIADCRKRLRNLPERHFPAVEALIRQRFANQTS